MVVCYGLLCLICAYRPLSLVVVWWCILWVVACWCLLLSVACCLQSLLVVACLLVLMFAVWTSWLLLVVVRGLMCTFFVVGWCWCRLLFVVAVINGRCLCCLLCVCCLLCDVVIAACCSVCVDVWFVYL